MYEEVNVLVNELRLENKKKRKENIGINLDRKIIVSNLENIINIKMAQPAPLSLVIDPLKYLDRLTEFNGSSKELENFINLIDKIHPLLSKYDALSQSIFSDIIKSKLRGRAREVIEINSHLTTWVDIKKILTSNFGEYSSPEKLFDMLRGVVFKNNSIEFYSEIKNILRRLNVKTKLVAENGVDTNKLLQDNKISALQIFKNKIPEPMRSILHCRNPTDLEAAMDILYEAGYAYLNPYENNSKKFERKNNYSNRNPNDNFRKLPNNGNNNISNNNNHRNNNRPQYNNYNNQNEGFRNRYNTHYPPFKPNLQGSPNPIPCIPQYKHQSPEPMDVNKLEKVDKGRTEPINFLLEASGINDNVNYHL